MTKKIYQPYYKKIDRSATEGTITIPKKLVDDFLAGKKLAVGTSREIVIVWGKKHFIARLKHGATRGNDYYQISYANSPNLIKFFRKTFIWSYTVLKSQKELFDSKERKRQFRSKLEGGEQEVMILQPIDHSQIEFEIFIKIKSEWNRLFERLADENVFGWLFDKDKEHLISRSTGWIKVDDFEKHKNVTYVIYYLINTKRKLMYIGKAVDLGKRIKPNKKHQKMPGDWNYFKYDKVKYDSKNILKRLEDHTIRAFASVLKNTKKYESLNLSDYTLVNSSWKKL